MHHTFFLTPPTVRTRPKLPTRTLKMELSGNHTVGILDCRLPDTHAPSLRLRIFYPTPAPTATKQSHASWLPPYPSRSDQVQNMLSSFLSLPLPPLSTTVLTPMLTPLSQQTLPAYDSAPLKTGTFPLVLFSHGLGGSTGGYAQFCMDLASHGRVVLAPEHSDGSAFVAYVGDDRTRIPYVRYNPAVHGPSDHNLRTRQLDTRLADFRRILACLKDSASFVPLNGLQCPQFSVDMTEFTIAGHSFGAATALLLASEIRPRRVICLDAWLQPVDMLDELDLNDTNALFVDMGDGMKISVRKREELCRPSGAGLVDAVRIVGGSHNNCSDFPMRLPKMIAVATGMTKRGSDPREILRRQNDVVERFMAGVEEWTRFREQLGNGDGVVEVVVAPVGRARVLVAQQ